MPTKKSAAAQKPQKKKPTPRKKRVIRGGGDSSCSTAPFVAHVPSTPALSSVQPPHPNMAHDSSLNSITG